MSFLAPFHKGHFFNHMEPRYVIRATEIKNKVVIEKDERGFMPGFDNSYNEVVEKQNKIMRANSVAANFCLVPLPAKVFDKGSYEYEQEFITVDCEYYGGVQIYIRFSKDDSLETKDQVVEFVLNRFHRLYNCIWEREAESGHTSFRTMCDDTKVQIYVSDNLGCYIETIKEERQLSEWELKQLQKQADGTIIRVLDDYKVNEAGDIVKVETRMKAHCSGTPE